MPTFRCLVSMLLELSQAKQKLYFDVLFSENSYCSVSLQHLLQCFHVAVQRIT